MAVAHRGLFAGCPENTPGLNKARIVRLIERLGEGRDLTGEVLPEDVPATAVVVTAEVTSHS